MNFAGEVVKGEAPSPKTSPKDYLVNAESRAKARQEWAEEERGLAEKDRKLNAKHRSVLMAQIQEKESLKASAFAQKQDEAQQIVKDAARLCNVEVQRSQERRMKNVRHQEVLQAQMSEHSQAQPHTASALTATELTM